MQQTGIIILAAGNASRMGRPKQLLPYNGRPFIVSIIEQAKLAATGPVVVVLGAFYEEVLEQINHSGVTILQNKSWDNGMGSSIQSGIMGMLEAVPQVDNVILAVADQPYVTEALFKEMIAKRELSDSPIVASSYGGVIGTPVLFNKKYFTHLSALQGKEGARKIVMQHEAETSFVDFPQGHIDIDTPEDYIKLTTN